MTGLAEFHLVIDPLKGKRNTECQYNAWLLGSTKSLHTYLTKVAKYVMNSPNKFLEPYSESYMYDKKKKIFPCFLSHHMQPRYNFKLDKFVIDSSPYLFLCPFKTVSHSRAPEHLKLFLALNIPL